MSNFIPATCVDGKVTAQGVEVPGTTILSEGKGQSSGVLHVDADRKVYNANTTPDLKEAIAQAIAGLEAAAAGLAAASSAIGTVAPLAGVPGPSVPLLTDPIDAAASDLEDIAETLSELKDNLK